MVVNHQIYNGIKTSKDREETRDSYYRIQMSFSSDFHETYNEIYILTRIKFFFFFSPQIFKAAKNSRVQQESSALKADAIDSWYWELIPTGHI